MFCKNIFGYLLQTRFSNYDANVLVKFHLSRELRNFKRYNYITVVSEVNNKLTNIIGNCSKRRKKFVSLPWALALARSMLIFWLRLSNVEKRLEVFKLSVIFYDNKLAQLHLHLFQPSTTTPTPVSTSKQHSVFAGNHTFEYKHIF